MASEMAVKAADAVCERWQVGTASRFCDDAPDWDSADTEEVATVIDAEFAPVLEAKDAEIAELRSERDALAAQVARLREACEAAAEYHEHARRFPALANKLRAALQEPSRE